MFLIGLRGWLLLVAVIGVGSLGPVHAQQERQAPLAARLSAVERATPREPLQFTAETSALLDRAAVVLEQEFTAVGQLQSGNPAAEPRGRPRERARAAQREARQRAASIESSVAQLLQVKQRVDEILASTFELRGKFVDLPAERQRDCMRQYLRVTSRLIDLSGRLRYAQFDALNLAMGQLGADPAAASRVLDDLIQVKSSIGAAVAAGMLMRTAEPDVDPAPLQMKVLTLIRVSGARALLPRLAEFLEQPHAPAVTLMAAETVRALGLPQRPRAGQDPTLPTPAITAERLAEILQALPRARLRREETARLDAMLSWLQGRISNGLAEDRFTLGRFEARAGDWLLMRNPSPYNLFTDLSPGLFTHVGVVTGETGSDGIRRLVLVDLPERGKTIPATNLDAFVERTLHYVLLRHPDPAVAEAMADAARDTIGNPSQFDLNFRTAKVLELKGQPLAGKKIETYCAGYLLLCAQQTAAPREEFFPVAETAAGGNTSKNLALLGLSVGEDFISPTGALFSARLQLVGHQEPMYDPRREVEEAVFDHFAQCLERKELVPAPDLFQSMRQRVAEAAKSNPLLLKALAATVNVDEETDLVSAAKAAAVVETLDEIAFGASASMLDARDILRDAAEPIDAEEYSKEDLDYIREVRARHQDLLDRWVKRQISPRELRVALVDYYIRDGKQMLDERFFQSKQP